MFSRIPMAAQEGNLIGLCGVVCIGSCLWLNEVWWLSLSVGTRRRVGKWPFCLPACGVTEVVQWLFLVLAWLLTTRYWWGCLHACFPCCSLVPGKVARIPSELSPLHSALGRMHLLCHDPALGHMHLLCHDPASVFQERSNEAMAGWGSPAEHVTGHLFISHCCLCMLLCVPPCNALIQSL